MIFISYSHNDSKWSEDLLTMAAPLQKYGGITVWSDADIAAGSKWRSTIQSSLDKAAVAVLLVSRHFLKSEFIMNVEFPYILRARESRGLRVLWILVSDCLYKETALEPIRWKPSAHATRSAFAPSKEGWPACALDCANSSPRNSNNHAYEPERDKSPDAA